MIKNWFKKIQHQKICAKTAILLLFFALSSSCTDQGCIDADDFGEYENQTIEVSANSNQQRCNYDSSKDLTDPTQGSGLGICFTAGSKTIYNEDSVSSTSSKGCNGFTGVDYKTLCIASCVADCLNSTSTSQSPEPDWISTDKREATRNRGVTIRPGSEIIIRAFGNVSLGNDIKFNSIHVQPNNHIPHSKDKDWLNLFFDVRNGQTVNLSFSGLWQDGKDPSDVSENNLVGSGEGAITNATYSGARRIIAYVIPHPKGYIFDSYASNEKLGTQGVPLLPDAQAWTCEYSNTPNSKQSDCKNKTTNPYTSAGYINANNDLATKAFPLSSSEKTDILTSYGGMIRWKEDGLTSSKEESRSPYQEKLGDISNAPVTITNPYSDAAVQVSLKSLAPSDNCNISLTVGSNIPISIKRDEWMSTGIVLEGGATLNVSRLNAENSGCGNFIGVKFDKYHDLKIEKSGFVKFTMLNGQVAVNNKCTINARIMNPNETLPDETKYEYDDFNTTSSNDPLANLEVPTSSSVINWSNLSFVRKGQVIRFSPSSWNGTWTTFDGKSRQCGIGMAMMIEPRPALLCRGIANDLILNTNQDCIHDYNSNSIFIGCKAEASLCYQEGEYYCPNIRCHSTITCIDGTSDDNYTKSCSITAPSTAEDKCPSSSYNETIIAAKCNNCSYKKRQNAQLPGKIRLENMIQCYDLENYTSKVSAIPTILESSDKGAAIGLAKIGAFNGSYGNLENFVDSGQIDTIGGQTFKNKIFQVNQPLTFGTAGRLRFFMLDGSDFNGNNGAEESYENNSANGTSYTGNNGFKIDLSGMYDFSNGQWLQGRLCLETNDNSTLCKSSNPTHLNDQPGLIEIVAPTASTPAGAPPSISTNYGFDGYGNILRISNRNPPVTDCNANANNGVASVVGANFYCHTYQYFSASDLKTKSKKEQNNIESSIQKLRLTFKILDPEVTNCNITTGAPATGNEVNNGIKIKNPLYRPNGCDTNETDNTTINDGYAEKECADPNNQQTCAVICKPNSSNTGQSCTAAELTRSEKCLKEYYCANKYANNTGSYFVNVKVKSEVSGKISSIIGGVIAPVIDVIDGPQMLNCSTTGSILSNNGVRTDNPLYSSEPQSNTGATCLVSDGEDCAKQYLCSIKSAGQAERIYKLVIADARFKAIVTMCFVVMFTFYGVGYLMGTSELNHSEIINRIIKIGVIYLFIGETGWDWFNNLVVRFFKDGTDYLAFMMASSFDDSSNHAVTDAIANSNYYDKSVLFSSVDKVFSMFFSQAVQKKISALLFASIFGWAYLIIIYQSFMLYVYSVANAVLLYLTAQVFISILFTLGPIFLIFILFEQTKEMFDNWLKQLIGFSLQQIFLLTVLAFFNMLMYEVIKLSLGYKICWDEVWTINIITRISLLSFWTIASMPPRTNAQSDVGNIGNPEGIPSLFSILFIWVIASLMNKFIGFMTDLAASISGGLSASSLGKGIADVAKEVSKMAKEQRQDLWNKTGGQAIQRMDKALFDSGAMADKERDARKANNAKDFSNKSAMAKAGNKAKQDYIDKNKVALSGMSKEEQRKTLKGVEDAAQTKAGRDLGLNDKDIDRLKNDKGYKFEGDTLAGAAASALKQRFMGGKTLNESLSEKSSDLKLSVSQASGKDLSTEDAKTLKDNITKGNVDVEKNTAAKLSDAAKTLSGAAGAVGGAMSSAAKAASETSAGKAIGGVASSAALGISSAASGALNLATSQDARKEAYEAMKGAASSAGDALSSAATSAKNLATNPVARQEAATATKEAAIGAASSAGKAISGAVSSGVSSAVSAAGEAVSAVGKAASETATIAKDSVIAGAKHAVKNPLNAAKIAAIAAVTAPIKATAGAASIAANAMSSAADTVEKMSDSKGYEATKQLEKEGAILPMVAGTNFARPDEEKKMIQDRVKQNENERKSEIKTPDLNTMTGVAKEAAYNQAIAAIDPGARLSEQIGARMTAAAKRYNPMGKQGAEIKKETKKDLLKSAQEQGKEKLAAVKSEKNNLETGRETAMKDYNEASHEVDAYKSSPDFAERAELVNELTEAAQKTHEGFTGTLPRIFNGKARQEDKAARKAQSKLREIGGVQDPKLAELTKKQDLAGAAVRQYDTKLANVEEKLKATEEFNTAATTVGEIIEEGQQRADLLNNKDEELKKSEDGSTTGTIKAAGGGGKAAGGRSSATSGSTTSGTDSAATRNKNISKFKDKETGVEQTIADKKTAAKAKIATTGTEKEGRKELKEATRFGNAVEKAHALSDHAKELMEKEDQARGQDSSDQTPHSGPYQRAAKLVQEYDNLESPEDAEKFVQEQEKRSKAIVKDSKNLDSPEEFKKFAKKFGVKNDDDDE